MSLVVLHGYGEHLVLACPEPSECEHGKSQVTRTPSDLGSLEWPVTPSMGLVTGGMRSALIQASEARSVSDGPSAWTNLTDRTWGKPSQMQKPMLYVSSM